MYIYIYTNIIFKVGFVGTKLIVILLDNFVYLPTCIIDMIDDIPSFVIECI